MEIDEYVTAKLPEYLEMVKGDWDYTQIDDTLVDKLFLEYKDSLNINKQFPGYSDTLMNLYLYAEAIVTRFFRDLHIGNQIEDVVTNVSFKGLINKIFVNRLKTEKKQAEQASTVFRTGFNSMKSKKMLTYVAVIDDKTRDSHHDANGITRPADDPIWETLNTYLSEWNCRCNVEISDEQPTPSDEIEKMNLTPIDSPSTIDYENETVQIFNDNLQPFDDYTTIRRSYKK